MSAHVEDVPPSLDAPSTTSSYRHNDQSPYASHPSPLTTDLSFFDFGEEDQADEETDPDPDEDVDDLASPSPHDDEEEEDGFGNNEEVGVVEDAYSWHVNYSLGHHRLRGRLRMIDAIIYPSLPGLSQFR